MEHFGDSGRLPSEQVFWRFGPIGPPCFGDFEKSDRSFARRAARAPLDVVRAPGARFGSELRSICVSEAEAWTHTECDFPLHIALPLGALLCASEHRYQVECGWRSSAVSPVCFGHFGGWGWTRSFRAFWNLRGSGGSKFPKWCHFGILAIPRQVILDIGDRGTLISLTKRRGHA